MHAHDVPLPDQPLLKVENLSCRHGDDLVVDELGFNLDGADIACLLGPSGCGKTTTLRAIAGFQPVSSGNIYLSGQLLSGPGSTVAPERREMGMVFQDYALFPHLSVEDNIRFGINHLSNSEQHRRVDELLVLTRLQGFGKRFPDELSGGQQQRVALARALARKPRLLLMDEPFSSLDVDLRRDLTLEIREILQEQQVNAIMVTHDQEEAFAFADRIGVMSEGRLQQWDTPFNLYHEPANRFVADFVGKGAFLPGHALDTNSVTTELGTLSGNRCYDWLPDAPVEVLLRPDDIVPSEDSPYQGTVEHKVFAGTSTLYTLALPTGSRVQAAFSSHRDYRIGDRVGIRVEADHFIAFKRQS
ncbi:ABC transporter ATP-binding protein [Biformimicrobium ophioploci]|uniref:ABC transporter ATP-binding protein n=1 Tax=Biformimicrobium ophioploci TaxID=3036711 RepID=A0ABQ6LZB0_9GAMM|nr:ABC transporter ATP-binding protein [Microbulbifer sp. NKW57]GMG87430.1 ABC transporter ATP-binding protein [Microbulbifer sp. NKW57]